MADTIVVQSKVRPEVRDQAEEIFNRAGLSMGDAIRLFLQQTINAGDIPFTITARRPSARLRKAMKESQDEAGTIYTTPEAMYAEWGKANV
ncbi:MAG: type II toxin-antitoxin system RelB/DinJ family antitoxin [Caldilineaceae bacterium]